MTLKATLLATAFFALLLLSWLLQQGLNSNAALTDEALQAADRYQVLEGNVRRDVLSMRVGLLSDFLPLSQHRRDLDHALQSLLAATRSLADAAAAADRLSAAVKRQGDLIEQFERNNAILRNSLQTFGRLSVTFSATNPDSPLLPAVSTLNAAMLESTLSSSPEANQIARERLDDLAAAFRPSSKNPLTTLLMHGSIVVSLLPSTDSVLFAILTSPKPGDLDAIRQAIHVHQITSRTAAQNYRIIIYLISVILVGILVNLGLRVRSRAIAFRRRAAFEHFLADISSQLIKSRSHEIPFHASHVLHELANFFGADRSYIVLDGYPPVRHLWQRRQIDWPDGWPEASLRVPPHLAEAGQELIYVPDTDRLPVGVAKSLLAAAGVRCWASIQRYEGGRVVGLLGLEWTNVAARRPIAESGLLLMALDAMANATGRERMEHERIRLEGRLQQARRMETVGTFAAGIAHNFNNTLAAILGYAEMEETKAVARAEKAGNIKAIRAAAERSRDFVEKILTFGRLGNTLRQRVDVKTLVDETASLLRATLPPNIELRTECCSDDVIVSGEATQLQQVIINLCNNAAQATIAPGQIILSAQVAIKSRAVNLSHGHIGPGNYVCLTVSDTGCGMDAATLSRVFESFFTTRAAGNGLGLATVREIVREHGGVMHVTSAPNVGSRFEVWLPLGTASSSLSRPSAVHGAFGKGETVVVVNQDRHDLLRDEEMLAALGYEPVGFSSEAAALSACQESLERFDALLISNISPDQEALSLASNVHKCAPRLAILLATRLEREIDTEAMAKAGVVEVLQQPLMSSDLMAALERSFAVKRR